MPLELTLHPMDHDVSLAGWLPSTLASLSTAEIQRRPVLVGNHPTPFGEIGLVHGSASDGGIVLSGTTTHVHDVASSLDQGLIEVHGALGRRAGAWMLAGRLTVRGSVGDDLGIEMTGGTIDVHGSAGDRVAGSLPGSRQGMRDGLILVRGDCGHHVAAKWRGGIVAVSGSVGDGLANDGLAGTVLVLGNVGRQPGLGMRRGSLFLPASGRDHLPNGFRPGRPIVPPFWPLLERHLRSFGFPLPLDLGAQPFTMLHGDFLALGRGEVFLLSPQCSIGWH